MTEAQIIYATTVIFLTACLLLINKYINIIKFRSRKFTFNHKVLESFENWLSINLNLHMTNYIKQKMNSELKPEEELELTPEFIQKGIDTVCSIIISDMPIYYREYMTQFYGDERLVKAIHYRTRAVFLMFVENVAKKRAGINPLNNTNNTNNNSNSIL